MCDVPSIAVFCNESIECFPGTASKFFFRLLVTILVAPFITGIIVHFRFHIRCISIHKLLYFNLFIIIIIIIAVEGSSLLGCYRVLMGKWLQALQRFVVPSLSGSNSPRRLALLQNVHDCSVDTV